jgi:hypothetical protein
MTTPEQLRSLAPHFPEIAKALEEHGGAINEQSLCAMALSLCRSLDANAWQEIDSKPGADLSNPLRKPTDDLPPAP